MKKYKMTQDQLVTLVKICKAGAVIKTTENITWCDVKFRLPDGRSSEMILRMMK